MRFTLLLSLVIILSLISLSDAKKHHKKGKKHHKSKSKSKSEHGIPIPVPNGDLIQASFTVYGSADPSSCHARMACGIYGSSNTAAINTMYYGVGNSGGTGSGCGRCWLLSNFTSITGGTLKNPSNGNIVHAKNRVVFIDNQCPGGVCGQTLQNPFNQFNRALHFDLCHDSGPIDTTFQTIGYFLGHAQLLQDCSEWFKDGNTITGDTWNKPQSNFPYPKDSKVIYKTPKHH